MISDIFFFALIGTLLYSLTTLVGFKVSKWLFGGLNFSYDSNLLLSSFTGLLIIVFVYSVIMSGGVTVNLLLLIPFAFYILFSRHPSSEVAEPKLDIKGLLKSSMVFGLVFIVMTILSIAFDYSDSINNDMLFYSNIGRSLGVDGSENVFHFYNTVLPQDFQNGTYPYHYFEFWFLSFVNLLVSKYPASILLKYVIYVFFKTWIVIGIKTLLQETGIRSMFLLPVIILATFLPVEYLLLKMESSWTIYMSIWSRPNFLTYLFVFLISLLLLFKKNLNLAITTLLILPIVSTSTAPALFPCVFILIIGLKIFKRINIREMWLLLLGTFGVAFSILIFYKLTGAEIKILKLTPELILEKYKTTWKAMLFFIVKLSATLLVVLIPLILLVYKKKNSLNRSEFILALITSFILSFVGIFIFQMSFFVDNSYQFPYVGYSMVLLVIEIVVLYLFFSSTSILIKGVLGLFLLAGLVMKSGEENWPKNNNLPIYSMAIKEKEDEKMFLPLLEVMDEVDGTGLFILDENTITDISPKRREIVTNQKGGFLYYINKNIKLYPFVDKRVMYKGEEENEEAFSKAHLYIDLMPDRFFESSKENLDWVVQNYQVKFLYFSIKDKQNPIYLRYAANKHVKLGEDEIIIL